MNAMNAMIPEFLVCPCCRGRLFAAEAAEGASDRELVCPACGLAFAVKDGIPMMVPHDARRLTEAEALAWRGRERTLEGCGPKAE